MIRRDVLSPGLVRKLERGNLRGYIENVEPIASDIAGNLSTGSSHTLVTQHYSNPAIRRDLGELKSSLADHLRHRGIYNIYLANGRENPNNLSLIVYRRG
jgi:hypothetical protein